MTKRSEIRVGLERFLRAADGRGGPGIVRDHRRRGILIPEGLVSHQKITSAGRCLADLGRRVRVITTGPRPEEQSFILAAELCQISREEPAAADGIPLPFGTLVNDRGLWLKLAPGITQVGVNDRGDVLLRRDPSEGGDESRGPVQESHNTRLLGPPSRVHVRVTQAEIEADRTEAEVWMRALALVGGGKQQKAEFKCAGVDGGHVSNLPYLNRTIRLNFFDSRDSEMLRVASLLRNRFNKIRREPPKIAALSVAGLPRDQASYAALQKKLKAMKKDPEKLGLPAKLSDSRFYDLAAKGIAPAVFLPCTPIPKAHGEICVVTVNIDRHEEVKNHCVLTPLASILSLVEFLSVRAAITVLNKRGTATAFLGPAGVGKTTAGLFWADRGDKVRRTELRRRYEVDLRATPDAGRMGEVGIQKELEKILACVGILCQEDWAAILKEGAGHWAFWPTERSFYTRSTSLPSLPRILGEHHPLLENAFADAGGGGDPATLGQVTHRYPGERVLYDSAWNHLAFDRSPRTIRAIVFLDPGGRTGDLVRRIAAREAVERLLRGQTADGRFEPLFNDRLDFSALLVHLGVVGDRLVEAYGKGLRGDLAPLGAGDAAVGEILFAKLDVQVKMWLDYCRETPTYVVNAGAGLDLTQDVAWALSEHKTAFEDWKLVPISEFQRFMSERYGVTYGPVGNWTHLPPARERG